MSLSLRDRWIAVLSPERVLLLRQGHAWRARPDVVAEAACAAPTGAAAADALAPLLAAAAQRSGDLTVVLSNHFVRYLLVPWRPEVSQRAELAAFAAICFDETFGAEPGGREIRCGRERAPSPRVAAAVEADLLARLRTAAAASRLRLVSIQPYLTAVFDRVLRSRDRRDFMFLVAEPDRACLLVATGGCWRAVRSNAAEASPESLAGLLAREAQLAGLADDGVPPIFVHAPGQPGLRLPPCLGVSPRSVALPGPAAAGDDADPLRAMAMAGA